MKPARKLNKDAKAYPENGRISPESKVCSGVVGTTSLKMALKGLEFVEMQGPSEQQHGSLSRAKNHLRTDHQTIES